MVAVVSRLVGAAVEKKEALPGIKGAQKCFALVGRSGYFERDHARIPVGALPANNDCVDVRAWLEQAPAELLLPIKTDKRFSVPFSVRVAVRAPPGAHVQVCVTVRTEESKDVGNSEFIRAWRSTIVRPDAYLKSKGGLERNVILHPQQRGGDPSELYGDVDFPNLEFAAPTRMTPRCFVFEVNTKMKYGAFEEDLWPLFVVYNNPTIAICVTQKQWISAAKRLHPAAAEPDAGRTSNRNLIDVYTKRWLDLNAVDVENLTYEYQGSGRGEAPPTLDGAGKSRRAEQPSPIPEQQFAPVKNEDEEDVPGPSEWHQQLDNDLVMTRMDDVLPGIGSDPAYDDVYSPHYHAIPPPAVQGSSQDSWETTVPQSSALFPDRSLDAFDYTNVPSAPADGLPAGWTYPPQALNSVSYLDDSALADMHGATPFGLPSMPLQDMPQPTQQFTQHFPAVFPGAQDVPPPPLYYGSMHVPPVTPVLDVPPRFIRSEDLGLETAPGYLSPGPHAEPAAAGTQAGRRLPPVFEHLFEDNDADELAFQEPATTFSTQAAPSAPLGPPQPAASLGAPGSVGYGTGPSAFMAAPPAVEPAWAPAPELTAFDAMDLDDDMADPLMDCSLASVELPDFEMEYFG